MRCKKPIVDKTELLVLNKEKFHAYHFSCASCSKNLDSECKDLDGKLYCPPCYNKGAWIKRRSGRLTRDGASQGASAVKE